MATGEYVSVSSQADTERADIQRERTELAGNDMGEIKELATIYVERGLDSTLANQVAEQLMAKDALEAHARDELGISETIGTRPVQAAMTSAVTFVVGAALPLLVVVIAPATSLVLSVAGTSLFFLAVLGALAAYTGGARILIGIVRVTFWGALAMAITAGIGALFGTAV